MKYMYINTKDFQHFEYVNNLRLEKVISNEKRRSCMADKYRMFGIVGNHTVDNISFLSKVKGKVRLKFLYIFAILIL